MKMQSVWISCFEDIEIKKRLPNIHPGVFCIFFNNYSPLLKVKKNSIERVLFNSNLKDVTSIRSIFEDRENNIWVATARGLVKLTNPLFLNYTKNSGLIENEVTAILSSKKKKLFFWVLTRVLPFIKTIALLPFQYTQKRCLATKEF